MAPSSPAFCINTNDLLKKLNKTGILFIFIPCDALSDIETHNISNSTRKESIKSCSIGGIILRAIRKASAFKTFRWVSITFARFIRAADSFTDFLKFFIRRSFTDTGCGTILSPTEKVAPPTKT